MGCRIWVEEGMLVQSLFRFFWVRYFSISISLTMEDGNPFKKSNNEYTVGTIMDLEFLNIYPKKYMGYLYVDKSPVCVCFSSVYLYILNKGEY